MNAQTERRSEKITAQLAPEMLADLRARQAEIACKTGIRASLNQVIEATLRRGLEAPART